MLQQFEENDLIEAHTGETVVSIGADGVRTDDGEEPLYPAGTVVLATGHEPEDSLAAGIEHLRTAVYVVGDARQSHNIYAATREGTEAALSIGGNEPLYTPR